MYYLYNSTCKIWLQGFDGNRPVWTSLAWTATAFELKKARRWYKRLKNLYSAHQKMKIVRNF